MSGKEMEIEIKRYLGIQAEDFQHRLNLAIDGLTGTIETVEKRLNGKIESTEERLSNKIDTVAKDLRKEMRDVKTELQKEIREVKAEVIGHRDNTEVHAQRAKTKKKA